MSEIIVRAANLFSQEPHSRREALALGKVAVVAGAAAIVLGQPANLLAADGDQPYWRFCTKCYALYFNGNQNKKLCPADLGNHAPAHLDYIIHYDDARGAAPKTDGRFMWQYPWRFCGKCQSLFYDGDEKNKGLCAAGGAHEPYYKSFTYAVDCVTDTEKREPIGRPIQPSWRHCQKCRVLYYEGTVINGVRVRGKCAGGGEHDPTASLNYFLPYLDTTKITTTPAKTVTIERASTVYDKPTDGKQEIAELAIGTKGVTLVTDMKPWFEVKWPGGQGWVYSGDGYEGAIAINGVKQ